MGSADPSCVPRYFGLAKIVWTEILRSNAEIQEGSQPNMERFGFGVGVGLRRRGRVPLLTPGENALNRGGRVRHMPDEACTRH